MGQSFVPALGYGALTPLYQITVDLFCRDSHFKELVVGKIEGEHLKILDIACGPGKLVRMIAEKHSCCMVTGLDIDAEMVETARANTSALKNTSIVQGNATDPPF